MAFQLVKKKIYPRIHSHSMKFKFKGDSTHTGYNATIIPVIMQDEGLGDPNSAYTNPESASFAEYAGPNCYPDSRVNFAKVNIELALSTLARTTDNVEVLKVMAVPIQLSFLENYTAKNEVTSEEVEDILEMQHETTDRQGYPLFNGNKLAGDSVETGAAVPGLTTNTNIEGITFDVDKLYDCLQYYTNGGKVRSSIGKIRWLNISKRRNFNLSFRIKPKAKRMNPYTFFGVLLYMPKEGEINQMVATGELSDLDHIHVKAHYRYNEWNENFNFMR